MDLTVPDALASELAAAFFQAAITLGLALVCGWLYRRYRKPYFGWWALAWLIYVARLGAIISFVLTSQRAWLYWHQVATGWTALALLWAALVFSRQLGWRMRYLGFVLVLPLWAYVAIYRLDNFMLAALPMVVFLSAATLWTAWVFFRHYRHAGSTGAALLTVTLVLWAIHHLDYPLLRARGVWNPWGYYLDIGFELVVGAGILLLVIEDLQGGVGTLSALSTELQRREGHGDVLDALLEQLLALPAVQGSAMYVRENDGGRIVRATGACRGWVDSELVGAAAAAVRKVLETGHSEVVQDWERADQESDDRYAYTVALPVLQEAEVTGALLIVGDARDPFAALDERFLLALGRQVGAALENVNLYHRLQGRSAELERLAALMVRQHEEERRRLSRELHDETAQLFSAVKLELGVLREAASDDLLPHLDRALGLVDEGIQSIREVTSSLRPSLLDDLGLVPALRALVQEFGGRSGIEAGFAAAEPLPAISEEAELAIFRALQEGLANVIRHASAQAVDVRLRVEGTELVLRMQDDGAGFRAGSEIAEFEERGRMGLVGMRERLAGVGGSLTIEPGNERGVQIAARVPVSDEVSAV
jgi:signal transduction histidine kinase